MRAALLQLKEVQERIPKLPSVLLPTSEAEARSILVGSSNSQVESVVAETIIESKNHIYEAILKK